MADDNGKLLYRGWLSTEADNGPLLYASSPTGNGEMVCSKEYTYYLSCTSYPSFNDPIFADYDGSQGGSDYLTDFDGLPMFENGALSVAYMGESEPHTGFIPYETWGTHAISGIYRYGWVRDRSQNRQWQTICRPYLLTYVANHLTEASTGKKVWALNPIFMECFWQWPDAIDIEFGHLPPEGYTFQQVVDEVRNWSINDWGNEGGHSHWDDYIWFEYKDAVGWNYRKKGYGRSITFNPASLNWCVNNGFYNSTSEANSRMLTDPGTYKVFIEDIAGNG